MTDVLAFWAFLGVAVWSLYVYHGVIAPYLDERGKRDRSFLGGIRTARDWKTYLALLEKEEGPGAARRMKLQGIAMTGAGWLFVLVLLRHRIGL